MKSQNVTMMPRQNLGYSKGKNHKSRNRFQNLPQLPRESQSNKLKRKLSLNQS